VEAVSKNSDYKEFSLKVHRKTSNYPRWCAVVSRLLARWVSMNPVDGHSLKKIVLFFICRLIRKLFISAGLKVTSNLRGCPPEKNLYACCFEGNPHKLYINRKVIKCRIR